MYMNNSIGSAKKTSKEATRMLRNVKRISVEDLKKRNEKLAREAEIAKARKEKKAE